MAGSSGGGRLVETGALEQLEQDVGSDVALRLIEMFLEYGPERVEAARVAVQTSDVAAAAYALHSLKSSALTLGATRLGDLVEQAERLARSGSAETLEPLIPPIVEACEQTTAFLRQYSKRLR